MGCGSQNNNQVQQVDEQFIATILDCQLRRNDQLMLIVCSINIDNKINQLGNMTFTLNNHQYFSNIVKQTNKQTHALVRLLAMRTTQLPQIKQTFKYDYVQYQPHSFPLERKHMIIAHQMSSVLMQKIVNNHELNLSVNVLIQHAHNSDMFFYDAFQKKTKCIGEDQLIQTMNDQMDNCEAVVVLGPLWMLRTAAVLCKYYSKPAFGLYAQYSPGNQLTQWINLESNISHLQELDQIERDYELSEQHLKLQELVIQAQNLSHSRDDFFRSLNSKTELQNAEPIVVNSHADIFDYNRPPSPKTANVSNPTSMNKARYSSALPKTRFDDLPTNNDEEQLAQLNLLEQELLDDKTKKSQGKRRTASRGAEKTEPVTDPAELKSNRVKSQIEFEPRKIIKPEIKQQEEQSQATSFLFVNREERSKSTKKRVVSAKKIQMSSMIANDDYENDLPKLEVENAKMHLEQNLEDISSIGGDDDDDVLTQTMKNRIDQPDVDIHAESIKQQSPQPKIDIENQ
ncbi:Conserved_hypothetical protein [Hexamita inflata]|uniref:Uncharacterized protein n=1 Tax=Hexamita inflata TaxID=28002 RepID=A0AA86NUM5_9EUKA|nr:Conserved hypothetical protein [Hexamita inflata]